jgi:hypothetical protein
MGKRNIKKDPRRYNITTRASSGRFIKTTGAHPSRIEFRCTGSLSNTCSILFESFVRSYEALPRQVRGRSEEHVSVMKPGKCVNFCSYIKMFRTSAKSKFNSGSKNEKAVNFPPEFIFSLLTLRLF